MVIDAVFDLINGLFILLIYVLIFTFFIYLLSDLLICLCFSIYCNPDG